MGVPSDKSTHSREPYFDKSSNTGWTHFFNATRFSLMGLTEAFRRESAFRQELAILIVLIPLGIWISRSVLDFVILMGVSGMVLIVELLNSAIEATVDRSGTEQHELAGLAKDYGSAAVMLSLAVSGMVWLTFLLQRIGII